MLCWIFWGYNMKRNPIFRILFYSLIIIILVGILLAGINFKSFPLLPRAESNSASRISAETVEADWYSLALPAEEIRSLEIDWPAGGITIEYADTEEICISADVPEDNRIGVKHSGSKLSIDQENKDKLISFGGAEAYELLIFLPMDFPLKELGIETASARVTLRNLLCDTAEIETVSGGCHVEDCLIENLELSTVSGDLTFSGQLKRLDSEAVSAKTEITLENAPREINIETISGNVTLDLPQDCGFRLHQDTLSGKFESDVTTTEKNGRLVYGDGGCNIDLSAISANLTLKTH